MNKKKVFKRIISMAFVLCFCFSAVFMFAPQTADADAPQVELYYAKTVSYMQYEGGDYKQYFCIDGYVAIENIAYDKIVNLHYSQADGTWQDVAATYVRTAPDGKEVWHFRSTPVVGRVNGIPAIYNTHWDFAIQYQVNGNTYWDNNVGNNYYLSIVTGTSPAPVPYVLKKCALILDHKYKDDISFEGHIMLKNLGYIKDVRVRYTTDNWQTYSETSASYYDSHANNIEEWSFNQAAPADTEVKFAISYTVNGVTYWDNNFGENYSVIDSIP